MGICFDGDHNEVFAIKIGPAVEDHRMARTITNGHEQITL